MKVSLCIFSAFLVLATAMAIDPWYGGYVHKEPKVIKVVKPVHHVVKVVKHLPPPIPVIKHVQLLHRTTVGKPHTYHHAEFIPVHHGGHGYGHGHGGHGHGGHGYPIIHYHGGHHGGFHGGHHGGFHGGHGFFGHHG